MASVRRPRYWTPLISGSGADCGRRSGSSGSGGASGLRNSTNGALDVTLRSRRRAVHMALGGSQTCLPSQLRCPRLDSLRIPRWLTCASSTRRTAVYGPVRTVVLQGQQVTAYLCKFLAQKATILNKSRTVRISDCFPLLHYLVTSKEVTWTFTTLSRN